MAPWFGSMAPWFGSTLSPLTSRLAIIPVASLCLLMLLGGCADEAGEAQIEAEPSEESVARPTDSGDEPSIDTRSPGDERSLERKIADASLAAQIRLALAEDQGLRSFDFEPTVVNGRVILRGEVQTQAQRSEAAGLTRGISGVRDLVNEVTATREPSIAAEDTTASEEQLLAQSDNGRQGQAQDPGDPTTDGAASSNGTSTSPSTSGNEADATAEEGSSAAEEESVYHTVRSGDSLWEIAREYGVTIDQIQRHNDLQSNRLMPGQRLRVR